MTDRQDEGPGIIEKLGLFGALIFASGLINGNLTPALPAGRPNDLGLVLFMLPGLLFLATGHLPRLNLTELTPLVVFIGFVGLSLLWSENVIHATMRFSGMLLASLWTVYVADRYSIRTIMKVIIGVSAFAAISSTTIALIWPQTGTMSELPHQWRGIYEHKNTLGGIMAYGLFFSALYLYQARKDGWVVGASALSLFVLFKTGSRTGFALAALAPAFCFYRAVKHRGLLRAATVIALLAACWAAGLATMIGYHVLQHQGETIRVFGIPFFLTGRVQSWLLALERLSNAPLLGFGYDGFWGDHLPGSLLNPEWSGQRDAHNGFVDVLLQTGLVGEALFLLMLSFYGWRIISRDIRTGAPAAEFGASVIMLFLVTNLTESVTLKATNIVQLLFTLCVVLHARDSGLQEVRRTERRAP